MYRSQLSRQEKRRAPQFVERWLLAALLVLSLVEVTTSNEQEGNIVASEVASSTAP